MTQQHRRVAETLRNYVEVVAIVAAGAWAFYQFVYVEKIKPAGEPAAAVERVSLVRAARIRGIDVIAATISIRNVGKTEFDVLAQSFELAGYRYAAHPATSVRESSEGTRRTDDFEPQQRHVIASYTMLYDGAEGGAHGVHDIVDPGGESTYDMTFAVPHGRYDLLRAELRLYPQKTPLPRRFVIRTRRQPDGSYALVGVDLSQDEVGAELPLPP